MSEFIPVMDMSGNGYTVCEHSTRRVLAGDVEAARRHLVRALESLGYSVVSENPLQARRGRLKDIVRADFNEHSRKLAVGLRQGGAAATQVTFDFAVTHGGCMTKGDLLTLEREVDAISALASAPAAAGLCRACGTENGGDAHFCRLCGAPSAAVVPAELEVLRLTAGSRSRGFAPSGFAPSSSVVPSVTEKCAGGSVETCACGRVAEAGAAASDGASGLRLSVRCTRRMP